MHYDLNWNGGDPVSSHFDKFPCYRSLFSGRFHSVHGETPRCQKDSQVIKCIIAKLPNEHTSLWSFVDVCFSVLNDSHLLFPSLQYLYRWIDVISSSRRVALRICPAHRVALLEGPATVTQERKKVGSVCSVKS